MVSEPAASTGSGGGGGSATSFAINVKDAPYNAKGDGVTDDGPAFNAAIAAANSAGGGTIIVPIPASFYKVTTTIDLSHKSNITILGMGGPGTWAQPEVRWTGTTTGSLITGFSAISIGLENIDFTVHVTSYTGDLVAFDSATSGSVYDCNLIRIRGCGFQSNGSSGGNSLLRLNHCLTSTITENNFNGGTGNCSVMLGNNAGSPLPNQGNQYVNILEISRNQFLYATGGAHIDVETVDGENIVIGPLNTFENVYTNGAIYGGPDNLLYCPVIEKNWFGDDGNPGTPFINGLNAGGTVGVVRDNFMFGGSASPYVDPVVAVGGNLWKFEGGYTQGPIGGRLDSAPGIFITDGLYFGFVGASDTNCVVTNPNNSTHIGAVPQWIDIASAKDVDFQRVAAPVLVAKGITGGGIPGLSPSRWVGSYVSVLTGGTWKLGDWALDQYGSIWFCLVAGSPGTWVPANSIATPTSQSGASYTFALADAGTVVEGTSGSAQTFTIPTNASVAYPTGSVIEVFQAGAGQITIAAAGGVTLQSDAAKVKTAAQFATVGLRKRATNTWALSGDLV